MKRTFVLLLVAGALVTTLVLIGAVGGSVNHVKAAKAGVIGIDGVMYDRPHLAKAERLLAHAGRWGRSVARME